MNSVVSVIIPAYNAANTIRRAIESTLLQDYHALEVIVVDDGSSDQTQAVVRTISDSRIRVVSLGQNSGAVAARNAGLEAATGEYVAFLDADDAWLPRKISTQLPLIARDAAVSLVTCDCLFLSQTGEVRWRMYERCRPVAGYMAWRALLAYSFIATPTVLARMKDVLAVGGFLADWPTGEDQDLWIRLASNGAVAVVPQVLVHVYQQPNSLTHRNQNLEADIACGLLEKHLSELRHRLSDEEICSIKGQRFFTLAANQYWNGSYAKAIPLFWRSATHGFRPLKSLMNIPRAGIMALARGGLKRAMQVGSLCKTSR